MLFYRLFFGTLALTFTSHLLASHYVLQVPIRLASRIRANCPIPTPSNIVALKHGRISITSLISLVCHYSPPAKQATGVNEPYLSRAPAIGGPAKDANEQTPKAKDVLAPISFILVVITATQAGLQSLTISPCLSHLIST